MKYLLTLLIGFFAILFFAPPVTFDDTGPPGTELSVDVADMETTNNVNLTAFMQTGQDAKQSGTTKFYYALQVIDHPTTIKYLDDWRRPAVRPYYKPVLKTYCI